MVETKGKSILPKHVFWSPGPALVAPGTVIHAKQPSVAYPAVSTMDAMTDGHTPCERNVMK